MNQLEAKSLIKIIQDIIENARKAEDPFNAANIYETSLKVLISLLENQAHCSCENVGPGKWLAVHDAVNDPRCVFCGRNVVKVAG